MNRDFAGEIFKVLKQVIGEGRHASSAISDAISSNRGWSNRQRALFTNTIYDIIKIYDVTLYARFMAWTAIWAAIWHWLVAVWNLCDYMRYVTDFSSETFGMYVGIIYMSKSFTP